MDLLDDLFASNDSIVNQTDLQKLLSKYKEKFGQAFPVYMVPDSITNDELCEKIRECLETTDGNILGRLGVKVDDDVLY